MDAPTLLKPLSRSELIPMSLYAEYVREREGKFVVENDKGFATYLFVNDGCYIEDIYVAKEYRKNGQAAEFADEIAKIAKQKGVSKLYGTVAPQANGATESLKVLLAYGFKLHSSNQNLILMVKDI